MRLWFRPPRLRDLEARRVEDELRSMPSLLWSGLLRQSGRIFLASPYGPSHRECWPQPLRITWTLCGRVGVGAGSVERTVAYEAIEPTAPPLAKFRGQLGRACDKSWGISWWPAVLTACNGQPMQVSLGAAVTRYMVRSTTANGENG